MARWWRADVSARCELAVERVGERRVARAEAGGVDVGQIAGGNALARNRMVHAAAEIGESATRR